MAITKNEQLVLDFFETLSNNDLEGVRKMFQKHATWTVMARNIPGAGEHKGRDAIINEFIGPIRGDFEAGGPRLEVKTIIGKGPLVLAEAVGRGRMKNGKDYHNLYAWAFEIKGSRINAIREYMDTQYVTTLGDD
jgi:ketosteroid isomerase-like protein